MSERVYCSEQNIDEPMIGTADPVDVWLLLEYRPAWKARAVEQSSLGEATRRWLDGGLAELAEAGYKARPQLIRRPELDRDEVSLFVGVPGALLEFSGRGYGFLDELRLVDLVARQPADRALTEPRYFVCTNGQRDLCCARFGLPTYTALRERVGGRAWQTTHLGGHRFAPNVLVLPQGALYGRVDGGALDPFLDTVERGALDFPRLRGRAWLPPPAQAAEALCGRSDLRLLDMAEDPAGVTVRFAAADGARSVRVRQGEPLAVLKSCGDDARKPVRPFLAG